MIRIGEKLRQRAKSLGLTDAEVARRVGLSQSRYANYISGIREPDFGTFVKICHVLETTPDFLLGFDPGQPADLSETAVLRREIQTATQPMSAAALRTARTVIVSLANLPEAEFEKFPPAPLRPERDADGTTAQTGGAPAPPPAASDVRPGEIPALAAQDQPEGRDLSMSASLSAPSGASQPVSAPWRNQGVVLPRGHNERDILFSIWANVLRDTVAGEFTFGGRKPTPKAGDILPLSQASTADVAEFELYLDRQSPDWLASDTLFDFEDAILSLQFWVQDYDRQGRTIKVIFSSGGDSLFIERYAVGSLTSELWHDTGTRRTRKGTWNILNKKLLHVVAVQGNRGISAYISGFNSEREGRRLGGIFIEDDDVTGETIETVCAVHAGVICDARKGFGDDTRMSELEEIFADGYAFHEGRIIHSPQAIQ